jgi:hypothetical protein
MTGGHRRVSGWGGSAGRFGSKTVAVALTALVLGTQRPVSAQVGGGGAAAVDAVDWMVGCWRTGTGVEEFWTDGDGGQMFGVSRSFRQGRTVRWEFIRVYEGRNGLVYAVAPSHQPPAEFTAAVATGDSVAFRNPGHDFPTSITYRRAAGDSLVVTVSGPGDDGAPRGFELRFGRRSCAGSWDRPGEGPNPAQRR